MSVPIVGHPYGATTRGIDAIVVFTEKGKEATTECEKWKKFINDSVAADKTWHEGLIWTMVEDMKGMFHLRYAPNRDWPAPSVTDTLEINGFERERQLDRRGPPTYYIANASAAVPEFKVWTPPPFVAPKPYALKAEFWGEDAETL